MKDELTQKLAQKYPTIFTELDSTPQQSCMAFGIECGDGWYDLLDVLCESLTCLYETGVNLGDQRYVPLDAPKVIATQIKEKFGTLRFYYRLSFSDQVKDLQKQAETNPVLSASIEDWITDYIRYIDGIIHMAESVSAHTCESTGFKGEMHRTPGGWYKVLSPTYAVLNPDLALRGYKPCRSYEQNLFGTNP